MSAVGKVVGGIKDAVFGGDKKTVTSSNFASMSSDEAQRLNEIETQIQSLYGNQGQLGAEQQAGANKVSQLFQQQLSQFLAGGSSNPNPTPEQLQQATSYVDQTFTNPAQQALQQYGSDFSSQAEARAAALGRNPNADIATQQAIAGEIAKQGLGVQSERGSRIAQNARQLNDVGYARNLQGLQVGQQGSSYLNGLAQQAFGNQVGLLNARSGLAGIYQKERGQNAIGQQTNPGILGTLTGAAGQIGGAISAGTGLSNLIGGIGQSAPSSSPYMSSNNESQFGGGNFRL